MYRIVLWSLSFFFMNVLHAQQAYLDEFGQKWSNAAEYTMECVELMPAQSFGFRPVEEVMTFHDQTLHMARNMTWLAHKYLGHEPAFEAKLKDTVYTKEILTEILDNAFDYAADAAAGIQPEDLEQKVDFFAGPMSKRQILTLMNDHLTHHRGQIIVYLRLQGVEPPKYRGW